MLNQLIISFLFIGVIVLGSWVHSQEDAQLAQIDSSAFAALEHNDPNVVQLANSLLENSQPFSPSIYEINGHTILGIINKDKGYYVTSLNNYLKALNAARELKDSRRISACYNNIGYVYLLQENYTKANDYFKLSLQIEDSLNQPLQKSIRLYNIGETYNKMDSLDLALSYFNNSLIIEKNNSNDEGIVYALLGIVEIYLKSDRTNDAQHMLFDLGERKNNLGTEEKILYHKLMGNLRTAQNQLEEALTYYSQAEKLSLENNFRIHLLDIYLDQILVLKQQEKWKESVAVFDVYVMLKDELNGLKVKNQLEDMTFQNELSKKELELELISEERDLEKKNSEMVNEIADYQTKIVGFLIFSFIALVAFVFFGIRKLSK